MSMETKKFTVPKRVPGELGYGDVGRPIKLVTNFFPITIQNVNITLFHYDVTIKNHANSEKIPKRIKRAIFQEWKKCFPLVLGKTELAFDGEKNAFSTDNISKMLKSEFEVKLLEDSDGPRSAGAPGSAAATPKAALPPGAPPPAAAGGGGKKGKKKKGGAAPAAVSAGPRDRNTFLVTFKMVSSMQLSELMNSLKPSENADAIPTQTMNTLEVMFRHYRTEQFLQIGRNSYFSTRGEFGDSWWLGGGKEASAGVFASLRPASWRGGSLMLNLDKAHCAFYESQPILGFVDKLHSETDRRKFDYTRPLLSPFKDKLTREIKGLKVRVSHSHIKRTYRVNGITNESAENLKFQLEEDGKTRMTTVSRYFQDKYQERVKYPKLNCLHVGNPQKKVFIPMEFCTIEKGQRVRKKLSDKETAAFIKGTAVPAPNRLRDTLNMAAKCKFAQDPILRALTFTVSDKPVHTVGRVLNAPTIMMKQNIQPFKGGWDVRRNKFYRPENLSNWAVIVVESYNAPDKEQVEYFIEELIKYGRMLGMTIVVPKEMISVKPMDIHKTFARLTKTHPGLQLIMCILTNRQDYRTIKKTGDCDFRVITQCLMARTVNGRPPDNAVDGATVNNILMKINGKLGGINNIVTVNNSPSFQKVMVMGADVNHPPAGGCTAMPSIAAVVGSLDDCATKYAVEVRGQEHRKEMITSMKEMFKNIIDAYFEVHKYFPLRILMYRDGVSESQFSEVLNYEMLMMREACKSISSNFRPFITFLCVQKRHHTRLYCENPNDAVGRAGNVPPGTIVDKDITHPTENDFYLCSHQGIQGTSKPAHYHVLWDDSKLKANHLQRMTYELCHLYFRCSKSVSIPAPAYYAHWAAFRSKTYASTKLDDDYSVFSGGSEEERKQNIELIKLAHISKYESNLSSQLYYI